MPKLTLCAWILFLLSSLSCETGPPDYEGYAVKGIDVSRYQGDISWAAIDTQAVDFVILKATEGEDYIDPRYKRHRDDLRQTKLIMGAYHFFRPASSIPDQLLHYYNTAGLEAGDLPPVLDIESLDGLDAERFGQRLKEMIEGMEELFGRRPILYTHMRMYYGHLVGRYDDYPIWIARYHQRSPELHPQYHWTFWQYSERGKLPGIEGPVDLNVYAHSIDSLRAFCLDRRSIPRG